MDLQRHRKTSILVRVRLISSISYIFSGGENRNRSRLREVNPDFYLYWKHVGLCSSLSVNVYTFTVAGLRPNVNADKRLLNGADDTNCLRFGPCQVVEFCFRDSLSQNKIKISRFVQATDRTQIARKHCRLPVFRLLY